jgi:hypothetical protein
MEYGPRRMTTPDGQHHDEARAVQRTSTAASPDMRQQAPPAAHSATWDNRQRPALSLARDEEAAGNGRPSWQRPPVAYESSNVDALPRMGAHQLG